MKSPDFDRAALNTPTDSEQRLVALQDLVPSAFVDGLLDPDAFLAALGHQAGSSSEVYELTWAGKTEARRALQRTTVAALHPDPDNSPGGFDVGDNVYIEGDNLEVLRLLQRAYNDRVKLIYIDPPYNTTNDFVYNDDFTDSLVTYLDYSGQTDAERNMVSATVESGGRRHSGWLTFMYPRLSLARNLLRNDGAIFVSIDDNEVHNLRVLMDEVFGPENFIATLVWKSKSGGANDSGFVAVDHEYVVVYARDARTLRLNEDSDASVSTSYNREDEQGRYALERLDKQNLRYSKSMDFVIEGPGGVEYRLEHRDPAHPNATWRWSKAVIQARWDELVFEGGHVYTKNYEKDSVKPRSLLVDERFGRTRTGKRALGDLVPGADFSNPKSVPLIEWIVKIGSGPGDLVLDFFSGSGTTGEAVLRVNRAAPETPARRFILVQLPEPLPENSGARALGHETLSDVGWARVVEAGAVIAPGAFSMRSLSLGESNFKVWKSGEAPVDADALGEQLALFADSLRSTATNDEIAAEVLLKEGVPLDVPWERRRVAKQHVVVAGTVAVCLAKMSSPDLVSGLLELDVDKLIVLDGAFNGRDTDKANLLIGAGKVGIQVRAV